MTDPAKPDAATLQAILADNQEWLIDRVLAYAQRQGYTRYTSTLREAWRQSIAGLSAPLLKALEKGLPDVELTPDADYAKDPLARFGIEEARLHRQRGVRLSMFLGLMKYYRQSYMDLVDQESKDPLSRQRYAVILKRFFDRIEIGLVTTWHETREKGPDAELQRANRTTTSEKSRYLTLFESLHCPVAVLDRNHRVAAVNHAWASLFRRSPIPGAEYCAADDSDRPDEWLAEEIKHFESAERVQQSIEKSITTPGGERHFVVNIKRMLDVSEKFNGTVVTLNDITQQKEAEAALQETTIWLKEMFNALEEAVFIETPNGRIVDVNQAAQQIFGYTAAELKDHTTKLLHVDFAHYEKFTEQARQALAENDTARLEYPARRKNGDVFPAMINIASLKKKDGTPLGIVSALRDVSSQRIAEEATRNSERFHGALELAGAVCHDMNQPLMAIAGYAELLLMDCSENGPVADKLKKIAEQVAKMGNITQKLMRVTRYETKMYMDQQIIDINKSSDR